MSESMLGVNSLSPTLGWLFVSPADSQANGLGCGLVISRLSAYDAGGNDWDRFRNNVGVTLLPSAVRSASVNTADVVTYNLRAVVLFLDVTVNPGGAQTLELILQAKDPAAGAYTTIFSGAAQTFGGIAGRQIMVVGPGAAAAYAGGTAPVAKQTILPRTIRGQVGHSGAGAWTYSIGLGLIT